jgi:hypothetical protein
VLAAALCVGDEVARDTCTFCVVSLRTAGNYLDAARPSATTAAAALIMLYLRRQTRIKSTMDFVARAFVPAVRK